MLFDKIKLHYPNVWIKDNDFYRMVDIITSTISKDYYLIDFELGFSKFVDNQWKSVLVPNPAAELGGPSHITTSDPAIVFDYLLNNSDSRPASLFINLIGDPAPQLPPFAPYFSHFKGSYRKAFWSDDLSQLPLQLIFISSLDVPEHYTHYFTTIEDLYPTVSELTTIVTHINSSSHDRFISQDSIKEAAIAGLGLTESQFIDLCLNSVLSNSSIDPKYIYDQKMSKLKRNGILEIIKPTITFNDIGGLDNIKDIIYRTARLWSDREKANSYGITPIRRMLMVGIPGTGKSAICQATANELNLDLARTGISQVMNSFIGQSEANMRSVFKQIRAMTPLCVWIDEFGRDLSGGASSSHVDGGTTDRVHGEFLTGLQELPDNVFLICAANQLENLRPEMLRADRFDKIMFVGLPSFEERQAIFEIYLRDVDTDHVYDYDNLADVTAGFTGAEIKALIKETKFYVVSSQMRPIDTKDIVSYAPKMRNILWNKSRDMIKDLYSTALEQWDFASSSQLEDARLIINGTYAKISNTDTKVKGNW